MHYEPLPTPKIAFSRYYLYGKYIFIYYSSNKIIFIDKYKIGLNPLNVLENVFSLTC